MYYVTMIDNFMSGWGKARGKTNIFLITCDTLGQAEQIENAAHNRSDMTNIKVCQSEPYYGSDKYLVSERDYSDLGGIWKA